ncbi:MAG: Tm-1-like ATP-binding domain-containing protein [Pseudomonadota bacterium]
MENPTVLVLATLETKSEEVEYLTRCLSDHQVSSDIIDTSLKTDGTMLDGAAKLDAMNASIVSSIEAITAKLDFGVNAILGLGGGTGGEIALHVMRALPITFPKVLVTTLPFDPRIAVADSSIVLVPTLADICGLNATLREVIENAAAMTAGLCATRRQANACVESPSIGITALGATESAVTHLLPELKRRGQETTVFHANGYGGAAFARFGERGALHTIIDLTPHELTRIHVAGAHVDMPNRFSVGLDLPRIVLPGGLNFIGLGERSLVPSRFLDRPHYEHSGFFTHAKATPEEMSLVARLLVESINATIGPATLIVPMGGFSHRDCPGGEIEDPELRQVFLDEAKKHLRSDVGLKIIDAHISSPAITQGILETLDTHPA